MERLVFYAFTLPQLHEALLTAHTHYWGVGEQKSTLRNEIMESMIYLLNNIKWLVVVVDFLSFFKNKQCIDMKSLHVKLAASFDSGFI